MMHGSSDRRHQVEKAQLDESALLAAVLRSDMRAFIHKVFNTVSPGDKYLHNWHIEAIVFQLRRCFDGDNQRLLITQPPRSLKSICTSVAFVAWALGHDPKLRFICVSYSDELAKELGRQFRMVVESKWYRDLFPKMRIKKDTATECITTKGGGRLSTSIGGTLTGRGADIIIIDDPLKAGEGQSESARKKANDWFSTTLVSRLNKKQCGIIIMVMQRLHEDDLAGFVLRREQWEHLDLPAIAVENQDVAIGPGLTHHRELGDILNPEQEPLEELDRLKRQMGSVTFSAQYQQRPVPAGGNVIRRDWIRYYDQLPSNIDNPRIIQSWDVATTHKENSSFSVCTTWLVDKDKYYLVDVWRGKLEFPDVKAKVVALKDAHHARTILIEKTGPGLPLVQQLRNDGLLSGSSLIGIKPEGDKEMRMLAQSPRFEAGHVLLPTNAPWLAELMNELLGFPNTKHDDQVDSVSQFLGWITRSGIRKGSSDLEGMNLYGGVVSLGYGEY